jgi:hypothetical protein
MRSYFRGRNLRVRIGAAPNNPLIAVYGAALQPNGVLDKLPLIASVTNRPSSSSLLDIATGQTFQGNQEIETERERVFMGSKQGMEFREEGPYTGSFGLILSHESGLLTNEVEALIAVSTQAQKSLFFQTDIYIGEFAGTDTWLTRIFIANIQQQDSKSAQEKKQTATFNFSSTGPDPILGYSQASLQ